MPQKKELKPRTVLAVAGKILEPIKHRIRQENPRPRGCHEKQWGIKLTYEKEHGLLVNVFTLIPALLLPWDQVASNPSLRHRPWTDEVNNLLDSLVLSMRRRFGIVCQVRYDAMLWRNSLAPESIPTRSLHDALSRANKKRWKKVITTQKGEFVCTCEECGGEFYGGAQDDFYSFVDQIKEEGWKILKRDGEWLHLCPDCREESC